MSTVSDDAREALALASRMLADAAEDRALDQTMLGALLIRVAQAADRVMHELRRPS